MPTGHRPAPRTTAAAAHASQVRPLLRWAGPLGSTALVLAAIVAFTSFGYGTGLIEAQGRARLWVSGAASVFSSIPAIVLAGAYLLSAVGWGRVPAALLARCGGREGGPPPGAGAAACTGGVWVQSGLGVALVLWLSHALAMAGALPAGVLGQSVAWGVVGVGLLLLGEQVVRGELRPEGWPVAPAGIMLGAPAAGLMLVAAASPPGWLWTSEAHGFDVLSYHLQLPREWSTGGQLWPLEHNVYSFLPSYVEAAYLHVAALLGGGGDMVRGDGLGLIAAQMLHVQMALLSAALIGRAVYLALRRTELSPAWARRCATMAGALFVCTPWVIVTGTLAYNEMGVTFLAAAALVLCVDVRIGPAARWVGAGLLMGAAASAKPTALFLATPTVGLLLLADTPARRWLALGALGAAAGVIMLAPWLVRNWLASGNPVFPFAAGLFGSGHWTAEQVARYSAAHSVDGGVAARLSLLLSGHRGALHTQWALFIPITLAALGAALAWPKARGLAALIATGALVQTAGWMFLTHEQSRFLLPLAPGLALGFGLGAGALVAWVQRGAGRAAGLGWLAAIVIASAPVSQLVWSAMVFARQHPEPSGHGRPNLALLLGASFFTGQGLERAISHLPESQRIAAATERAPNPTIFCNAALAPDQRVYLLGDAAPLYFTRDVLYHTTWDASPLGEAVREHGADPAAWTQALRERGVTHVLVNYDELARYTIKDGWYDPDVSLELAAAWLEEWAEPVAGWPAPGGGGAALYRLRSRAAPEAAP